MRIIALVGWEVMAIAMALVSGRFRQLKGQWQYSIVVVRAVGAARRRGNGRHSKIALYVRARHSVAAVRS